MSEPFVTPGMIEAGSKAFLEAPHEGSARFQLDQLMRTIYCAMDAARSQYEVKRGTVYTIHPGESVADAIYTELEAIRGRIQHSIQMQAKPMSVGEVMGLFERIANRLKPPKKS